MREEKLLTKIAEEVSIMQNIILVVSRNTIVSVLDYIQSAFISQYPKDNNEFLSIRM